MGAERYRVDSIESSNQVVGIPSKECCMSVFQHSKGERTRAAQRQSSLLGVTSRNSGAAPLLALHTSVIHWAWCYRTRRTRLFRNLSS